jgi:hypothetical protein
LTCFFAGFFAAAALYSAASETGASAAGFFAFGARLRPFAADFFAAFFTALGFAAFLAPVFGFTAFAALPDFFAVFFVPLVAFFLFAFF